MRRWRTRARHTAFRLFVALATFFVAAMTFDRAAGWYMRSAPEMQVAHPPNFHETRTTLEFSYEFQTNSMGLRERELPLSKDTADEFRAVVVGDSFTEGWGVATPERFTSLLEQSLAAGGRAVHVINCGLGGAGPLQYARILFSVGLRYHPDLALMVIYANDLSDTPEDGRLDVVGRGDTYEVPPKPADPPPAPATFARRTARRVWPWTYDRLRQWSMGGTPIDLTTLPFWDMVHARARHLGIPDADFAAWKARVPERLWQAVERGEFNGYMLSAGLLAPDVMVDSLDIASPRAEAKWSAMRSILDDTVALCRTHALRCAVVFAPTASQYDATAGGVMRSVGIRIRPEWLAGPSVLEGRLEAWATGASVPYLSLADTFRAAAAARPGHYHYALDEHWNASGHQLAAETIGRWLDEARLDFRR